MSRAPVAIAALALVLAGCSGPPVPAPDLACTRVFRPYPYPRTDLPPRAAVWLAGHNAAGRTYCPNWQPEAKP